MIQCYLGDKTTPRQSNGRLYKQVGNSVVVPVIERIAKKMRRSQLSNSFEGI